jgi:hypothetical protein
MTVYSINPNSGEYIKDKTASVSLSDFLYSGTFNYTPVYPRYTFVAPYRFNYQKPYTEIEFITMLPIKRFMNEYLVEIRFKFIIDPHIENSLEQGVKEFHNFCEMNKKKLKPKRLII